MKAAPIKTNSSSNKAPVEPESDGTTGGFETSEEQQTTLAPTTVIPSSIVSKSELALHSIKSTTSSIQKHKKKGTGVRCEECRKRIGPACQFLCRCGHTFCTVHRIPEAHKCSFDYRAEGRRIIREANPVILPTKVTEI